MNVFLFVCLFFFYEYFCEHAFVCVCRYLCLPVTICVCICVYVSMSACLWVCICAYIKVG